MSRLRIGSIKQAGRRERDGRIERASQDEMTAGRRQIEFSQTTRRDIGRELRGKSIQRFPSDRALRFVMIFFDIREGRLGQKVAAVSAHRPPELQTKHWTKYRARSDGKRCTL